MRDSSCFLIGKSIKISKYQLKLLNNYTQKIEYNISY